MFVKSLPLIGLVIVLVGGIIFNSDTKLIAFDSEPEVEVQITIDEQNEYIVELERLVAEQSDEIAKLVEENRWDTVVFLKDPEGMFVNEFLLTSEYRNHEGEYGFYEVSNSRLDFENSSTGKKFQIDALIGELVVVYPPLEEGGVPLYDACFHGFTCRARGERARVVDD